MEEKNMEEVIDNNEEVQEVEQENEEVLEVQKDDVQEAENSNQDAENNKEDEQKRIDHIVETRLKRERRNIEKDNKELYEIEGILKAGLGVETRADMIAQLKEFYGDKVANQQYQASPNERDEKILAKADADEVIELGLNEMETEANRIASIPEAERSIREQTMFNTLCEAIIEQRQVNELKDKGIKTEILEDKDFKEFKNKFAFNTPISDIYEMYSKLNSKPIEKPASAGSAKSESGKVGEVFSAERINSMTPQELMKYWNNPDFRKVAGLN